MGVWLANRYFVQEMFTLVVKLSVSFPFLMSNTVSSEVAHPASEGRPPRLLSPSPDCPPWTQCHPPPLSVPSHHTLETCGEVGSTSLHTHTHTSLTSTPSIIDTLRMKRINYSRGSGTWYIHVHGTNIV